MNKQKFLKELEKRLAILSEAERNDTINEYRDIIEEKVKHGKTEEEAVREFGSIDELTKEILTAYKIDPEYQTKQEGKDQTKGFVETTEDLIKKGAQKISEVANEVAESVTNSNTFTTENVIHIVFKIFFILLGLAILKIPFSMISEIGESIFEIHFLPFSRALQIIWKVLIEFAYLIICIFVVITYVKKYFNSQDTEEQIYSKRQENNLDRKIQIKKKIDSNKNASDNIFITLIKIFICAFIFFPICCINFGLILALAFVIYLIYKGVSMLGILLTLVGILIIGFEFCHMIYNVLFIGKKHHFLSLIIGFIITLVGLVSTIDYVMGFTFYNELPNDKFTTKTITYEEQITVPTSIMNNDVKVIVDSTLEDNFAKFEVTYYDENNASVEKRFYKMDEQNDLYFDIEHQNRSFNWNRDINEKLIDQLKTKEIYNYDLLNQVQVKVYVNDHTKDFIQ